LSCADLCFLSLQPDTSLHCKMTDSRARALRCVTVCVTGTQYVYPQRDGQAELTWVAGYIPRWSIRRPTVTQQSARMWETTSAH